MMSEKRKIQRFNLDEGRIWEAIEGLSPYKTTYTLEEVCEKLNEQQDIIDKLKEDVQVYENTLHFLCFCDNKQMEKKILEQQAIITKQERRIRELESILADDIIRKSEIKDAWKQRTEKRWNDD